MRLDSNFFRQSQLEFSFLNIFFRIKSFNFSIPPVNKAFRLLVDSKLKLSSTLLIGIFQVISCSQSDQKEPCSSLDTMPKWDYIINVIFINTHNIKYQLFVFFPCRRLGIRFTNFIIMVCANDANYVYPA